jgi:hypothetical protein
MKKIFTLLFAVMFIFSFSSQSFATIEKDNENQDFQDTSVSVNAPLSVLVGNDAKIIITVDNDKRDRGLPQLSILVNDTRVAYYEEIAKGSSVEYVLIIDTSIPGKLEYNVEIWTRLGNKNYEDLLFSDTIEIEIIPKAGKTPDEWLSAFRDALIDAVTAKGDDVVFSYGNNGSAIRLTIDNIDYNFIGGGGPKSSKSITVDGTTFIINISGNPAIYSVNIA